ncbi:MAG: exodeoxyribonuclease III [Candidatus Cloacimonadota bacterium]|nr:MAG: exodeoxyribonuclease III [Candidatus Cloacimonadota bacterium]
MKIISWNVNGLRAVIKKNFFEYIKDENPDIIGLQETKLGESQIPAEIEALADYHKYWSFAEKKGYSGTLLLTKKKPNSAVTSVGESWFDDEGRIIRADFDDFVLFNVYFPNGQMNDERLTFKMDFYDKFLALMNEIRDSGKNVMVMGDYNTAHKEIDLKNPKANAKRSGFLPIERAWIDKVIGNGYVDTFREFNQNPGEYSWWSYRFSARKNNAGWRIDYVFVNKEFLPKIKNAFIRQDILGSDHCPVGVEI